MKNKLITADIKKLVQSGCKSEDDLKKFELSTFNVFKIGNASVKVRKGSVPELHIDESFTTEYAKMWRNDIGGVLIKELRKEDPELYEVKTNTFRALLKKVSESELEQFKEKGFDHVTVGDNVYTIIKAVNNKKVYADKTDDYEIDHPEDDEIKKAIREEVEEEEEIEESNSYALF